MVNKRGWIRIVEASISILIILGVLLVLVNVNKIRIEEDLTPRLSPLLAEMAENLTIREMVINYNPVLAEDNGINMEILSQFYSFLDTRIGRNFEYKVRVCQPDKICALDYYPDTGNVYAADRLFSTTLNSDFTPKRVKIFLWLKE